MRAAWILILVGEGLASARGSCGGGGHGGGGGGHGGGGHGGGGHGGGHAAFVIPCVDGSEVVGREHCRAFGDGWAAHGPLRAWGAGTSLAMTSLDGASFDGRAEHFGKLETYHLGGTDLAAKPVPVTSFDARFALRARHLLYAGIESSLGVSSGLDPGARTVGPDGLTADVTGVTVFGAGLYGGVEARLGLVGVRAEVLAGAQILALRGETHLMDCTLPLSATILRTLVEPRTALALYLAPRFAVGASAGVDLTRRTPSFGLFVEIR